MAAGTGSDVAEVDRGVEPKGGSSLKFSLVSTLVLGVVIGITEVSLATSFAALVFSGPLAKDLPSGVGLALFAAAVTITIIAIRGSGAGSVATVQDITAVVLGVMGASIARQMPVQSEQRFLTLMLLTGMTSVVTGAVFWVVGRFRWGNLVRYVPYPVIAGFVAGTGWLILKGGASLLSDVPLSISTAPRLLEAETLAKWVPGVALAVVIHMLLARHGHPLIVPGAIVAGAAVFYGVLLGRGGSVSDAETGGWLLGPFPDGSLVNTWLPSAIAGGDWSLVLSQASALPSLLVLALVALLLNVSGIEVATRRDLDVNRELRSAGVANIVGGMGGGLISFHSPTLTLLSNRSGANTRTVAIITAATCALVVMFGASILGNAPKFVIGGLLLFLGFDLLLDSAVRSRSRLPRQEHLLVLLILVTIAVFGFMTGVGIGVAAAVCLFVVNYGRTEVVKHELSGESYRSKVERLPSEQALLRVAGDEIYILELQGFIFFGTAFRLLTKIRERSANPFESRLQFLILDFHGVSGFDSSAALSFERIHQLASAERFILVLTGLSNSDLLQLLRNGLTPDEFLSIQPDLDHGIEWCEEQILKWMERPHPSDEDAFPSRLQELVGDEVDAHELLGYLERVEMPAKQVLIRQGDPPGDIYFLATGSLTAVLEQEDGSCTRLRTMGPGSVVGEVAMFLHISRTESVISDTRSIVYRLSPRSIELMKQERPELVAALQGCFGRLLAGRLAITLRTVNALLS